jgi:hypothetical protein
MKLREQKVLLAIDREISLDGQMKKSSGADQFLTG